MAAVRTIEEFEARQTEIRSRVAELDTEYAGQPLSGDARTEWNALNEELDSNAEIIDELRSRTARVAALAGTSNAEREEEPVKRGRNGGSRLPDDIHDMSGYRSRATSPEDERSLMRQGARVHLETASFPHERAKRAEQQEHIDKLLEGDSGELAERILVTGSETYKRAFGKKLMGRPLTGEENASLERAASLTTTAGGFAVPYTLDPTVILTSSGVVNPLRAIARIETITGNEWRGVSSTGITAAYSDEAVEASDNTPTLAQPTANVEKAQAFVPFSIEIGEDWGSFQSEMARLFQDAKDVLESDKFLTGLGHTSHGPEGLLVGATAIVSTAATATFAVADVYALEEALGPRWQARASILASKRQFNKVRQFDTAGGANLWVQLGDGTPSRLLDYPSYQYSNMSAVGTSGASIMTIGDFNEFLIIDRVGMSVELVPHMFATGNNFPNGQRGLYAYWRNTSKVLTQFAFKTLKIL